MKFTKFAVILLFSVVPTLASLADDSLLDKVQVKPAPGTVALTFDDGPDPTYTPQVLAILKKY